jgi:hypothetical protein
LKGGSWDIYTWTPSFHGCGGGGGSGLQLVECVPFPLPAENSHFDCPSNGLRTRKGDPGLGHGS